MSSIVVDKRMVYGVMRCDGGKRLPIFTNFTSEGMILVGMDGVSGMDGVYGNMVQFFLFDKLTW